MNWVSISSGNDLSPVYCQVITWTDAGLLLIGYLGTNFSEIQIKILPFSIQENVFEIVICEMAAILFKGRWVSL